MLNNYTLVVYVPPVSAKGRMIEEDTDTVQWKIANYPDMRQMTSDQIMMVPDFAKILVKCLDPPLGVKPFCSSKKTSQMQQPKMNPAKNKESMRESSMILQEDMKELDVFFDRNASRMDQWKQTQVEDEEEKGLTHAKRANKTMGKIGNDAITTNESMKDERFKIPKESEIINKYKAFMFGSIDHLEQTLIKELNSFHKAIDTFYCYQTPNYVVLKCKVCKNFQIWFKFQTAYDSLVPINLIYYRSINQQHLPPKQESDVLGLTLIS